jgi:uncharacterized protein DUF4913
VTRRWSTPRCEACSTASRYPPQEAGARWRAVWAEDGRRRYCEAVTEEKLAAKLAKVTERLEADAPGMGRSGADLIAWYLSSDRLPADEQWSRKHTHTQQRLCERFVAPVIGGLSCQDIRVANMQRIVNAAPTTQEGGRLHALISALVGAGREFRWCAQCWQHAEAIARLTALWHSWEAMRLQPGTGRPAGCAITSITSSPSCSAGPARSACAQKTSTLNPGRPVSIDHRADGGTEAANACGTLTSATSTSADERMTIKGVYSCAVLVVGQVFVRNR